jgi:hypothetical protein
MKPVFISFARIIINKCANQRAWSKKRPDGGFRSNMFAFECSKFDLKSCIAFLRSQWQNVDSADQETFPRVGFFYYYFRGVGWDWVHLACLPLIGLLYQPRMIDEYRAFGGMRIGRGNRNTLRKPVPVLLRPPQIPHDNLKLNPGRRGEEPATNRLSYGTAFPQVTAGIFRCFY